MARARGAGNSPRRISDLMNCPAGTCRAELGLAGGRRETGAQRPGAQDRRHHDQTPRMDGASRA
jgi:hypothetical protein